MHTVIVDGQDLAYFASICQDALSGQLGSLRAVQVYVQDDGRIVMGTNGYTSQPFGRPNSDLSHSGHEARMNNLASLNHNPDEGHGNPYANVEDDESQGDSPASLEERVAKLERLQSTTTEVCDGLARVTERLTGFAENASLQYGIRLDPVRPSSREELTT